MQAKVVPGSSIYRFLECTAGQYMTSDVKTVTGQVTMAELEGLFEKYDFNAFPVVEESGITGIVTKFDFLRTFAFTTAEMVPHYDELMRRRIADAMTEAVVHVEPDAPLTRVLHLGACEILQQSACKRDGSSGAAYLLDFPPECRTARGYGGSCSYSSGSCPQRCSPRVTTTSCGENAMTSQHAISLQDIVGERMQEHHGGNLACPRTFRRMRFQFRHRAWMHSLIDRRLILRFSFLTSHRLRQASTPGPSLSRGWNGSLPFLGLVGGQ